MLPTWVQPSLALIDGKMTYTLGDAGINPGGGADRGTPVA